MSINKEEERQGLLSDNLGRWARIKKQFDSESVSFNAYDFVAPLWQAVATYGLVICSAWLYDDCPLNAQYDSKINYKTVQKIEIALFFVSYFINLPCRYFKKHHQLQHMQRHINHLKKSNAADVEFARELPRNSSYSAVDDADDFEDGGDYDHDEYELALKSYRFRIFVMADSARYRLFSAGMASALTFCLYAVATVPNNKSAITWDGCWDASFIKIAALVIAALAGSIQENPLDVKRRELEREIQILKHAA